MKSTSRLTWWPSGMRRTTSCTTWCQNNDVTHYNIWHDRTDGNSPIKFGPHKDLRRNQLWISHWKLLWPLKLCLALLRWHVIKQLHGMVATNGSPAIICPVTRSKKLHAVEKKADKILMLHRPIYVDIFVHYYMRNPQLPVSLCFELRTECYWILP